MSTELLVNDKIAVIRFWGGDRGTCIQIISDDGHIQFTKNEFKEVLEVLRKENFIDESSLQKHPAV